MGHELSVTVTEFINGSETPDCTNGRAGEYRYVSTLKDKAEMAPIVWVNENFKPSTPPAGLETVTMGNLASGLLTAASVVAESEARVNQLNASKFCGFSDWKMGEKKSGESIINCLTGGFNPGLGVIIVDDSRPLWRVYDAIFDPRVGYMMPNHEYHEGPF